MALIIAVLYFGLIELMLYDASRELAEARRFRARMVALTLAENAAELAAVNLVKNISGNAEGGDWQGTITGTMKKNPDTGKFEIDGTGVATGVVEVRATVKVLGVVDPTSKTVSIENTFHSQ